MSVVVTIEDDNNHTGFFLGGEFSQLQQSGEERVVICREK